jgi:hypothetical protein
MPKKKDGQKEEKKNKGIYRDLGSVASLSSSSHGRT